MLPGEDLYNFLMRQIEPELTTDILPTLSKKHSHETEEQAKTRADRYSKAFEMYEKCLDTYRTYWTKDLQQYHKEGMTSLQQKNKDSEKEQLSALENTFDSSLPT